MMIRIDSDAAIRGVPLAGPSEGTGRTGSFQELLRATLGEANRQQVAAEGAIEALLTGRELDPTAAAAAINRADLALRTLIQIRNRLVDAFQELRQMPI